MALTASQIASRLFKKSLGAGETKVTREFFNEPIRGRDFVVTSQIWSESDLIPNIAPTLSPGASAGVVQYFVQETLTHVAGSDNLSYYSSNLVNSIPFNYGDGVSYNYTLYKNNGTQIFAGDGEWLVDNSAGLLTFYGTLPSLVNSSLPPKITFYRYIGNSGLGFDAGGTITGVTAGNGLMGGGTQGSITIEINPSLSGLGLTYSSGSLNVLLGIDSGLTFSGDDIILDTNIAGNGLDFSSGVLSVNTSEITNDLAGNGLTANGSTLDVNVNSDSLEIVSDVIRLKDIIVGDRTFQNDVTISGNLTVNGTTSYIYTENLVVEDNVITLNATWSGNPILNAGIEVNRGNETNASLIWDESLDLWSAGLSGSEVSILLNSGSGLTKNGATVSLDFESITGTGLTQNGSVISIDTNGFASDIAGDGLSANGGTLSVNVGNGLEVSSDTIYLGGTLSQNTNIELLSNTLTIETGLNQFYFDSGQITLSKLDGFGTSSNINFIDGQTNWSFVVSGSESSIYLSQGALSTDGTVNTMLVRDTLSKKGLVYADDYTGNFTTHSLVTKGYVDSAVPNVGAGNGLQELSPAVVGLGGTLSQNTTISGESFDLTIQNFDVLTLTGSVVDIQLDNGIFLVDVTSGGSIDLYGGDVTINATGSIDLTSTDEFTVSTGKGYITTSDLEGLVYTSDYSGTFVTNSLVTKGYVDSSISNVGATNGIIEYSPGVIGLGGTLSQNTLINGQGFSLTIGDLDNLIFTGSVVDVELDNGLFLVDAGDTGSVDLYAGDVLIYGSSSITITSLDEIDISAASASITTSNLRGLEYSTDYSGTFVTNSLVTKGYVDSGTSSIWSVINTFSSGLTPSNGLDEVSTGYIGLGGTLSVSTFINADNFDLTIGNVDSLTITASIIDFQLDNGSVFIDSGDNGSVDIYAGGILIYATSSVDIATSGEFTITTTTGSVTTTNLEGLVYTSDYTGTFVTNSLVTKGYVDNAVPNVGATNGLSEITTGVVGLGGTISQNTTINANLNDLTIDGANIIRIGATGATANIFIESINDLSYFGGNLSYLNVSPGSAVLQSQIGSTTYSYIAAENQQVYLETYDGVNQNWIRLVTNPESNIDGSSNNYMIINDATNKGLVYYGDYTANFTNNSLVTKGYVDSVVSSIGADNGLTEIVPGVVGLGGTLSSPTVINGDGFDLTIGNIDTLLFTSSIFDVESDFISLDAGTGSVQIIANSDVSLVSLSGLFGIAADSSLITVSNGEGLVYSTDYTSTFVTHSLVTKGYVDSGTSSIWSVINTFSSGLTPSNGLTEITPGIIGLGGTLSLSTVINGDGFDLTIGDLSGLLVTSDVFDVESSFISIDAGTGSMQLLADGDIDVMSVGEISIGGASGKVTTSNNQGLVYTSDYTSTFVTQSLVTKGYVDSIVSGVGADNGLTEFLPGTVSLGGSLSQNTLIDVSGNTFSFLDTTGTFSSFFTMATNSLYGKTIEMGLTEDLTNSASSSYISFNVDSGTILQDYNKQVQIATTVPFGAYLFKITAASQSIGDGSTDNHMIIDDYGSKGLVYADDYTGNFTQNSLVTKSFVVNYINTTHFSQNFSVPSNTSGDGASTFQSILYTPFDSSSVQVFVNGVLQRLGDGVTASVDCYFSADGGLTPLGIDGISSGDILYWNGLTSKFDLETDDEISIVYQYKP